MAKIISVSNQKGGVGKTTTSVNLASSLAAGEKRVLLIDFDPQGNSTSGLGHDHRGLKGSIYDVVVHERPLKEIILKTELEYLDLAPSCQQLVGAEIELVSAMGRESRLKDVLEDVIEAYDYIIIDCAPTLGLLTINALTASHTVLIPLQCEYYAMEGLSQLLNTITLIKRKLNPQLLIEGILLTMYDRRNNLAHQVEQEIRSHFGKEVFNTVIPRNVTLSEAPSHGKPVLLYDIASTGAVAYLNLAKELISRGNPSPSRKASRGVYKQLKSDQAPHHSQKNPRSFKDIAFKG